MSQKIKLIINISDYKLLSWICFEVHGTQAEG